MKYDLDVVFLGGLFPQEVKDEIYNNSIGSVQFAADALQWNLVEGFNKLHIRKFKIINSLYIGSYPKRYKKLRIKSYNFRNNENYDSVNVGFNNLAIYKMLSRKYSIRRELKAWASDGEENKVIIAYALTSVFLSNLLFLIKINPNIRTCIIVPDLPQYMNTNNKVSLAGRVFKCIDISNINRGMEKIEAFVLLTKQMNEFIHAKNFVVVEGIATDKITNRGINTQSKKMIFYAGTLNERYGIKKLIAAFMSIDDTEVELVICGDGDSRKHVEISEKKDKRIIYKGNVTPDEVAVLYKSATIIVNPRDNNEEFTKYSFPSKNLEALSSGKPLIGYKLDGIPDEYDEFIYYVDGQEVSDLAKCIQNVIYKSDQELNEFGLKAREFVLTEKNNFCQAKKIIEMMLNINEKIFTEVK